MLLPLVSVIVPTKNSSLTLEECLSSIHRQSYKQIELIVVDNFSTDETPVIAKLYADRFFSEGPERSAQRNFAAQRAKGKFICVIDSDMILDPTVIGECVDEARQPGVRGVVIPEESFGIGFWARCKQLERSFYVGVPYMEAARFFKKADFISAGGYNETMVSGEDWDLSQRIESGGTLGRSTAIIHHNEGSISLRKTISKKFYYAQHFSAYTTATSNQSNTAKQTSTIRRYVLFFSRPRKLFKNPVLGTGMLFMKTCEFVFGGMGFVFGKIRK